MKSPDYPGYGAECNGCGLCCLSLPCCLSLQYSLWQNGKCIALRYDDGRYWCNAISNPERLPAPISDIPLPQRIDAIAADSVCDSRRANSIEGAKEMLGLRNVRDTLSNSPIDTYPRGAVAVVNGKDYAVYKMTAQSEIIVEELNV
jgi:hypothetical protein